MKGGKERNRKEMKKMKQDRTGKEKGQKERTKG